MPPALFALVIFQVGSCPFCLGPASDCNPPPYTLTFLRLQVCATMVGFFFEVEILKLLFSRVEQGGERARPLLQEANAPSWSRSLVTGSGGGFHIPAQSRHWSEVWRIQLSNWIQFFRL
jgi:hypothetical protein